MWFRKNSLNLKKKRICKRTECLQAWLSVKIIFHILSISSRLRGNDASISFKYVTTGQVERMRREHRKLILRLPDRWLFPQHMIRTCQIPEDYALVNEQTSLNLC